MTPDSFAEARTEVRRLRASQRQRLIDALTGLADVYIATEQDDPRRGMEAMCEDFFEAVAASRYPGGWGGLLGKAMRQAG